MRLPSDWLSLDAVNVTDIALRMQKEVAMEAVWPANGEEEFQGVALVIELSLPAIPIPFLPMRMSPPWRFDLCNGIFCRVRLYL